jgi:thioredoxin
MLSHNLCFLVFLGAILMALSRATIPGTHKWGLSVSTREEGSSANYVESGDISNVLGIRGGAVSYVNSVAHLNEIMAGAGDKLIAIDFTATWCGPCKMIAPVYEELATFDGFIDGAIFLKCDVDQAADVAAQFQVQSMPTFVFLRGGKIVDRFSGASAVKLKDTLMKLMK